MQWLDAGNPAKNDHIFSGLARRLKREPIGLSSPEERAQYEIERTAYRYGGLYDLSFCHVDFPCILKRVGIYKGYALHCQGKYSMAKNVAAPPPAKEAKRMANYRLKDTTLAALAEAAKADERNASSMVEKILTDWLKKRGFLK